MLTGPDFPSTARCLKCGYLLCGLPTSVCPECGRAFDPTDASTYDLRPPEWRKRRIKRIVFVVAGCIALWVVFGPRALLQGKLEFKCAVCGETSTYYRWEPKPPRWIAQRFSGGFNWSHHSVPPPGRPPRCRFHSYGVSVKFDMHNGGWCSGSAMSGAGGVLTLNGMLTTVETAPEVLAQLMDPLNNGVQVGPSLVP